MESVLETRKDRLRQLEAIALPMMKEGKDLVQIKTRLVEYARRTWRVSRLTAIDYAELVVLYLTHK